MVSGKIVLVLLIILLIIPVTDAIVKVKKPDQVELFLELTDTPSTYSGSDGLCLKVNETLGTVFFGTCAAGGGGGDITAVLTTSTPYLDGGTTSGSADLVFNETLLNATIDDRAGGGGGDNASWNESYADDLYVNVNNDIANNLTIKTLYLNRTDSNLSNLEALIQMEGYNNLWQWFGNESDGTAVNNTILYKSTGFDIFSQSDGTRFPQFRVFSDLNNPNNPLAFMSFFQSGLNGLFGSVSTDLILFTFNPDDPTSSESVFIGSGKKIRFDGATGDIYSDGTFYGNIGGNDVILTGESENELNVLKYYKDAVDSSPQFILARKGAYTGGSDADYVIEIDGTNEWNHTGFETNLSAEPPIFNYHKNTTFRWTDNYPTWNEEKIVTGSNILLNNNIRISFLEGFGSESNFTIGEQFNFTAVTNPESYLKIDTLSDKIEFGVTNVNVSKNITATYVKGNGSELVGVGLLNAINTWNEVNAFQQTIVTAGGVQALTGQINTGLDFNALNEGSAIIFNATTQISYNGSNTHFEDFAGENYTWYFDDSIEVENATTSGLFCTGDSCGNVSQFLASSTDTNCNATGTCSGGDVAYMNYPNQGNFNISNSTFVGEKISFTSSEQFITHNASEGYLNGDFAIWIHDAEAHTGGDVAFILSAFEGGYNRTILTGQVGLNESAGTLGNSWMIIPNNFSTNMTFLSNCVNVINALGLTPRISCDTGTTGADLFVQDSLQIGGKLFSSGIRVGGENGGTAEFIMNGNDFEIIGDMHIRKERLEEVGNDAGDQVILLTEDFGSGTLGDFYLITDSGDPDEWTADSASECYQGICAVAGRIGAGPTQTETIMEANFSSTNFNDLNISFRLNTTNLDAGDLFNVTINNNVGSGEVQLYAINNGTNINDIVEVDIPSAMDDRTTLSLRFSCGVNQNLENCNVDNILVYGNATTSTTTNVTRFDSLIKGGTGDGDVYILYNDTSGQWTFQPSNITADVSIDAVNSSDFWDDLDTPADINTSDITDDNTYVEVAGDTMTGNLILDQNLTVANSTLYTNSTCTIITGPTSELRLC